MAFCTQIHLFKDSISANLNSLPWRNIVDNRNGSGPDVTIAGFESAEPNRLNSWRRNRHINISSFNKPTSGFRKFAHFHCTYFLVYFGDCFFQFDARHSQPKKTWIQNTNHQPTFVLWKVPQKSRCVCTPPTPANFYFFALLHGRSPFSLAIRSLHPSMFFSHRQVAIPLALVKFIGGIFCRHHSLLPVGCLGSIGRTWKK